MAHYRSERVTIGYERRASLALLHIRLWTALRRWHGLSRSRRHLLELSDEHLRDIGVSRAEALAEGRRSFYLD
ncbi:DUF1127 domain-containing protein [Consotaella salsifontis]|uniref:DUF1127 domain-containing protein n=1 Tax=Consotaella salsifontis TaxID=1365950 RepID=UPI00099A20CD|nr:DUF1127 domain-containing protein [Consotaella salsifontis]